MDVLGYILESQKQFNEAKSVGNATTLFNKFKALPREDITMTKTKDYYIFNINNPSSLFVTSNEDVDKFLKSIVANYFTSTFGFRSDYLSYDKDVELIKKTPDGVYFNVSLSAYQHSMLSQSFKDVAKENGTAYKINVLLKNITGYVRFKEDRGGGYIRVRGSGKYTINPEIIPLKAK